MIARLRGTVVAIDGDSVTLDVNGVGYDLAVPTRLAETLRLNQEATLQVHTSVREDAISLYAFDTAGDKSAFQLLIGVSGIGPRTALAALSTLAVAELARAIEGNDLRALGTITGVGRKTAERIVLELRGKFAWAPTTAAARPTAPDDPFPLALAQLGYKRSEIDVALARLVELGLADAPLNDRVAAALRGFAGAPR